MRHHIALTDEELRHLAEALERDLGDTHTEHRRTRNPDFREGLEHRISLMERLLEKIHAVLPAEAPML